jgi:hypothetical protein
MCNLGIVTQLDLDLPPGDSHPHGRISTLCVCVCARAHAC